VVVVGGGIAGLACAQQLGTFGVSDVVLLEAEPMLATHASARNAAIFQPLEESLSAVWLAQRSRDLLDARLGTSWLSAQGVTLVAAEEDALDELRFAARRFGVFHERLAPDTLFAKLPALEKGEAQFGIHLPLGGVMDIHMVLSALARWAKASGTTIVHSARVETIDIQDGRVRRVIMEGGASIQCERVVIAAGAWAGRLGMMAGTDLELTPLRRHLVHLVGPNTPRWKTPTVWRVDDQTYFRPEAGGILASPCDEEPWEPCVPETDPTQLEALAEKLVALAPGLADGQVRRAWACLRTMSEDREIVAGDDPRARGLYWLAGLGGRGMTCGVAAAELVARLIVGLPHPLMRTLQVGRFV
jgi:glycine/D-amino acid oxidase-like deaminating enzyme